MLIMLSKFRFFRSSFLGKVICICQVLRHTWFLRYLHSTWFFACIMCMCLSRAIYVCCNVCTCMRVCFSMFDEMAYINRDSLFCACKKWEEMWFNFIWRCGVCSKIEKAAPNRQFQRRNAIRYGILFRWHFSCALLFIIIASLALNARLLPAIFEGSTRTHTHIDRHIVILHEFLFRTVQTIQK